MVGNGREFSIQDVVWEGIANAKDLRKDNIGSYYYRNVINYVSPHT